MFILKDPEATAKCRIFTVVLYENSVDEYYDPNEKALVYERKVVQRVLYTLSGKTNLGGGSDENLEGITKTFSNELFPRAT